MTIDILFALITFAFVSAATPGPNNVMLMASAANFGVTRTLPHMMGIAAGLVVMLFGVGVGLSGVFAAYPVTLTVLRAVCAVYLIYLAYRIATAAGPGEGRTGRPFRFIEAAAFQWVNPKAWAMALGAITVYAPDTSPAALAMVAVVFALVSVPSMSIWVFAGRQVARFIRGSRRRIFNIIMALLLIASLIPALL